MRNALKFNCSRTASSASVVDGKLILSFPGAITPVVWQMDLSQAKASALEVRENADRQQFVLTLKNPKGETVDIAPFESREQAVESLMAASRALTSAHGQIRPAGAADQTGSAAPLPYTKSSSGGRWLGLALALALFLVLGAMWSSMSQQRPGSGTAADTPTAARENNGAGVPQSADDFLSRR